MKIRICLAGATGWIGTPLAAAIAAADDLELVAAVSRSKQGEQLGDVAISGSVADALAIPSDVFVDYTSASAVKWTGVERVRSTPAAYRTFSALCADSTRTQCATGVRLDYADTAVYRMWLRSLAWNAR